MRSFLIALVVGVLAVTMAAPCTAEAHWRHVHRVWHHGPSYYTAYGFYNFWSDPYGPVCVWHRAWDAYWQRDCF